MKNRPDNVKAAILVEQNQPLVVDNIELPERLFPGQVLVKVECSGICGSQIGEISGITQERSIDVMITRLRQKIEVNPKNPKYLQTIRGSGYVLWIE